MQSLIYVSVDEKEVCIGKNPDLDDLDPVKMTILCVNRLLRRMDDSAYVDMLMNAFSLGRWLKCHCHYQQHYLFQEGVLGVTNGEIEVRYNGKNIALKGHLDTKQEKSFLVIAAASLVATALSEGQTYVAQSYLMHLYAKKKGMMNNEEQGVYTH